MSAGAKLESVWIQWSDCGNHIRRWQRTPFYAGEEITALVVEPVTAPLGQGASVEAIVAGKRLTIKPGAPEIALLCRAIFRSTFADDEDEAVVNAKYNEWPEDQAKAIRAAKFVLRALGGDGAVVRALPARQEEAYRRGITWAAKYVERAGAEASHPASVIACRTIADHLRREAQEAVEDADLALEQGR